MWFIYAVFSALAFGLAGFMMKVSSMKNGSLNHLLWGLYFSGTLAFLWWVYYTDAVILSAPVVAAGTIIGIGSAMGNVLFMKALDHGPASLTSPLVNSHILLTVFMSLLLYKEDISFVEIIGIVLLILAVSLLPIDPNESMRIRNGYWYGLVFVSMVLFFLRNGGLKITEEMNLPNTFILFISYLYGFVWFTLAIQKERKQKKQWKEIQTGLIWGIGSGIFSFAGMQLYSIALDKGPASIVAPIFATNSLIVVLLSIVIYRERLSLVQSVSLILLLSGIVALRVSV